MKTTLDLPPDVARTLRLESARRGGRRIASLSKLVSDAVREVYSTPGAKPAKVDWVDGRVVVKKVSGQPEVRTSDVQTALDD
jgi:hypothetical protein